MPNNATSAVQSSEQSLLTIETDKTNTSLPQETTTDRNLDLIRRKLMLMQIGMDGRYGPDGIRHRGFGSGALPLMPGKSPRPNVFETRQERRQRLLDEERYNILLLAIKIFITFRVKILYVLWIDNIEGQLYFFNN